MSTQAIIPGSLGAIARKSGSSLAETFLSADAVVLVDTSASMDERDARGGLSRYTVACSELAQLQNSLPGKIAVVAFSSNAVFCPSGIPQFLKCGTDMAGALKFTQIADGLGLKIILISDGEPDSPLETEKVASQYKSAISTIYVGPDDGPGSKFLKRLASLIRGKAVTAQFAQSLAEKTSQFLLE